MAEITNQLTVSKALEIAKQNKHGNIDPVVTAYLGHEIDCIWQRVQAQPLTYIFTKEEFALFNHYRGALDDNEIAQQAVRRFWEHYNGKPASDPELRDMGGNVRRVRPCDRCRRRRIRCNGGPPFCRSCEVTGNACVYTDGNEKIPSSTVQFRELFPSAVPSSEDIAEPQHENGKRGGARNEFYAKISRSKLFPSPSFENNAEPQRVSRIDASRSVRDDKDLPRSQSNLLQLPFLSRNATAVDINSIADGPIEGQDQYTPQISPEDPRHLEFRNIVPLDLRRFCVQLMNGEEYSVVNSMKLWMQSLTGKPWDWWPLRQSLRPLQQDESRIRWYCVSHRARCIIEDC